MQGCSFQNPASLGGFTESRNSSLSHVPNGAHPLALAGDPWAQVLCTVQSLRGLDLVGMSDDRSPAIRLRCYCGRVCVATVSEVLRSVARDFVVLAGAAGLGREVRRILFVRPPNGLTASFGRDDLVVYAGGGAHADSDAAERVVTALLGAGVAGVRS